MNTRELEVKYKTNLSIDEFVTLVKSKYDDYILAKHIPTDYDWYYKNSEGVIIRHRYAKGCKHELTVKSRDHNYEKRDEFNIDLGLNPLNLIESWLDCAGFQFDFWFEKEIYVFNFLEFQIAYYHILGTDFKFIEIEYLWQGTDENEVIDLLHHVAGKLELTENVNRSVYYIYKEWLNENNKEGSSTR